VVRTDGKRSDREVIEVKRKETKISRRRIVALLLVGSALALTACSSSKSSDTSTGSVAAADTTAAAAATDTTAAAATDTTAAAATDTTAAAAAAAPAALPQKVKSAGKLVVCSDASYAPMEFFDKDGKTVVGVDADLAAAIAKQLGVTADVQNAGFDSIIPSLGTRCDMGISSFGDTKKREDVVDFVTYAKAGTSFIVAKGQNADITSLDAICGKAIGVEKGTTQLDDATAQSKKCTDGGAKAVDIQAFPDFNGATLALTSGRVAAVMGDTPVTAYLAQQSNGAIESIGDAYGSVPWGIALPKSADYAGLSAAVQGALKSLDASGGYDKILAKWGVSAIADKAFAINGAIN
jgi:polar amino acid transport system substrate-binding protein